MPWRSEPTKGVAKLRKASGALAKIKKSKSRKRLDAEKMLMHSRELDSCSQALEKTVHALDDLKPNELGK